MDRPVEVLLVEDSVPDATLARQALMDGPVPKRVTTVTDGAAALEYLRRTGHYRGVPRPDIVLLDLNLPKRDGIEVLREIKSDPDLRAITVIVLTTSNQGRDVNAAYDLSANCYVVKPMGLDEFNAAMRGIEEFWMTTAALPTYNLDPMRTDETRGPGAGESASDVKGGSAGAGASARRARRRSALVRASGWLSVRRAARG